MVDSEERCKFDLGAKGLHRCNLVWREFHSCASPVISNGRRITIIILYRSGWSIILTDLILWIDSPLFPSCSPRERFNLYFTPSLLSLQAGKQENSHWHSIYSLLLMKPFTPSQDLHSNSPYCQPYSSGDVGLENLLLDQLKFPSFLFFFDLITCLLDIAYCILYIVYCILYIVYCILDIVYSIIISTIIKWDCYHIRGDFVMRT